MSGSMWPWCSLHILPAGRRQAVWKWPQRCPQGPGVHLTLVSKQDRTEPRSKLPPSGRRQRPVCVCVHECICYESFLHQKWFVMKTNHSCELQVLTQVWDSIDPQCVCSFKRNRKDGSEEVLSKVMKHFPLSTKLWAEKHKSSPTVLHLHSNNNGIMTNRRRYCTDGWPGGGLPDVIQLPVQSSHGLTFALNDLGLTASIEFSLCFYTLSLHHLQTGNIIVCENKCSWSLLVFFSTLPLTVSINVLPLTCVM